MSVLGENVVTQQTVALLRAVVAAVDSLARRRGGLERGDATVAGRRVNWAVTKVDEDGTPLPDLDTLWRFTFSTPEAPCDEDLLAVELPWVWHALFSPQVAGVSAPLAPLRRRTRLRFDDWNTGGHAFKRVGGELRIFWSVSRTMPFKVGDRALWL